ncbi:MAG: adenylate/guanylate cyclase domain-containing protein [Acidimicrobiia bacterium]|nr:adenylate/guanylate cyclase domain-containing protein [Acidimicrobiia bacterium]
MAAAPGRIARNTSVATRLSLVVLLVALISLVITAVVGLARGGEVTEGVLRERITAIGAGRAEQVELYLGGLERAVISEAISPDTAEAIDEFAAAHRELQRVEPSLAEQRELETHYVDTVAPALSAIRGRQVTAASLIPRDPAAVHLQANYVAPRAEDVGLLDDAGDGSRWSELHSSVNQSGIDFAARIGVDDLYLIEPDDKTIVYSTAKDIDFATSLVTGPQSGTALAALINSFGDDSEAGVAAIADFTRYAPAGDEPSLFVASPVVIRGATAGYVAIRIGPGQISSITTNDGSWGGQGDTGETYVVARDGLMRSDARGFIEDENSYLAAVAEVESASEDQIRSMAMLGTTVLFQPIDDQDVDRALDEEPGLADATNYLGADVVQALRSLDIDGLDWAIVTEVEAQELDQPIEDFVRNLLVAIALFLVAVTFIAVRWADRLLQPLRIISTKLRAVRAGNRIEQGVSSGALPANSPTEFAELAGDIDTMLETLAARNAEAAERAAERRRLLRQILPPQAAHRAAAGETNVIDQVTQATVAVVVIGGLGSLMRAGSTDAARALLDRFVEESDALAKQRGLERIRLTGDAYFAACGTVRPHIDHASRAVSFVLDVRNLVADLGDDGRLISMHAGVDTGPVTVGLTGGSGLVYDAWGPTVQGAADLARRSGSNEVLISAAVRTHLSTRFVVEDRVDVTGGRGTAVVSGRMNEGAPVR